ncbi:MAG: lamin tail domain-containing protein [Lewinella sp.]|nr:lamin tail domain-containing protein [Lewinella sp.]
MVGNNVDLFFDGDLTPGQTYTIIISQAQDLAGNQVGPLSASITRELFVLPNANNPIITEFMADPTPQVGLPNTEYVEIHNRSDTLLNIEGLLLGSGGTPVAIAATSIPPRGYLTIVGAAATADFPVNANLSTVPSFPALTNDGDLIELYLGTTPLQRIDYTSAWYNDPARADGGYSIELTKLDAPNYNCQSLWAASQGALGGTPGQPNSVDGLRIDSLGPELLTARFVAGGIELTFSETLSDNPDLGAFSLNPDLGPRGLLPLGSNRYLLETTNGPAASQLYTLAVENELQDCAGNFAAAASTLRLGLAEGGRLGRRSCQ